MLFWTASIGIYSWIPDKYCNCHFCICFVLSRIDYCSSLLFGSTHDVTSHMQRIQNNAARIILRLPMSSSITTHLISLHWLPVNAISTYKIACLCYHCHSSTAPSYVADMLRKKPSHTRITRSSSCTMPLLNRPHTVRQHLENVHFLLLLLLAVTPFQMMSGVPHRCHRLGLVWRHTCFVQFTKNELCPWSLYICAWLGLVMALLMVFLKNALMCIKKSQINWSRLSAYFDAVTYNACLLNVVFCFI